MVSKQECSTLSMEIALAVLCMTVALLAITLFTAHAAGKASSIDACRPRAELGMGDLPSSPVRTSPRVIVLYAMTELPECVVRGLRPDELVAPPPFVIVTDGQHL